MGLQAWIVDRPTHGEVVEHLKAIAREPEDPVGEVVEEAADAGAADAACFGLKVEDLSDDACLPIQAAVEPGPERIEGRAVLGEHGHCEDAVGSDFLISTTNASIASPPQITALADGSFAVTWNSLDNGYYYIRGRVFAVINEEPAVTPPGG